VTAGYNGCARLWRSGFFARWESAGLGGRRNAAGCAAFLWTARLRPESFRKARRSSPASAPIVSRPAGSGWPRQRSSRVALLCSDPRCECKTLPTPELTTQHFRSCEVAARHLEERRLTIEGLLYLPPDAGKKKFRSSSMCTAARSAPGKTATKSGPASSSATAGQSCAPTRAAPALRRQVRRSQQERSRRRRLPRRHGRRRRVLKKYPIDPTSWPHGLQLRRRDGRLRRRQDRPLQGHHLRRAGHRSVQRIRHRARLLVRPLVLRQALGAHGRRLAAKPALRRSKAKTPFC
jgi:hypothetical protein